MAQKDISGVLGFKCFLILYIIVRIHTLGDTSICQLTTQDQHEQTTETELLFYYKLNKFDGYFPLNAVSKKIT